VTGTGTCHCWRRQYPIRGEAEWGQGNRAEGQRPVDGARRGKAAGSALQPGLPGGFQRGGVAGVFVQPDDHLREELHLPGDGAAELRTAAEPGADELIE
jgi:hypothetical protein